MWQTVVLLVVVALALAAAIVHGALRWRRGTAQLHARLEAARLPAAPATYDAGMTEGLPAPVRRYFRAVLQDGQAIVETARLRHTGRFNLGAGRPQWRRFRSTQRVVVRRPGFDWDARIAMAPGLAVFVHDAYVAGEGILHAELAGLLTLADLRGTPAVAQGELIRFLAEAAWYPTALLPGQGVRWTALDDRSARATLSDGAITVTLDFCFDAEGLIEGVRADARYRLVDGALVATPWRARFWAYEWRGGMRIPLEGEVAWELPAGPWPYWRGRLLEAVHDCGGRVPPAMLPRALS